MHELSIMRQCRNVCNTHFDAKGCIGQICRNFGDRMDGMIDELNEALAA